MSAMGAKRAAWAAVALTCAAALAAVLCLAMRSCGAGDGPVVPVEVALVEDGLPSEDAAALLEAAVPSAGEGVLCDAGVPGRDVTDLDVCSCLGRLVETASGGLGVRATWEVGAGLEECAAAILGQYEGQGGVSLEHDGAVDLLGRVWGCVVASEEGWAELVLVDARASDEEGQDDGNGGTTCSVTLVRFGQEAVAQAAAEGSV